MLIVIEILLAALAAWSIASIFVLGQVNRTNPLSPHGGLKFGLAIVAAILALGFLGILVR